MRPTRAQLRRHFAEMMRRASGEITDAEHWLSEQSLNRRAWMMVAYWRGRRLAWEEALRALDTLTEDDRPQGVSAGSDR